MSVEEDKKRGGIELEFTMPDITPTDEAKRKEYVSGVSFFYENFGRELFEDSRRDASDLLRAPGNTREQDLYLKANIAAFDTIERWCKKMDDENKSNMINNQE